MSIRFWRKKLFSRVWKNEGDSFVFPEDRLEDVAVKASIGIVISGGGTRSATAGHGQLRGLFSAGYLPKVKYLSSNSGGTWVSVPFTYTPNNKFFSDYLSPNQCTLSALDKIKKDTFLDCVTHAGIIQQAILEKFKTRNSDESFSRAIGNIFLEKFGLDDTSKSFTYSENEVEKIAIQNGVSLPEDVQEFKDHFYWAVQGKPYLIANGTMYNAKGTEQVQSKKGNRFFHIEFTPLYSGVRVFHPKEGKPSLSKQAHGIGGGYLDSFAFDSKLISFDKQNKIAKVRIRKLFNRREKIMTLSDVMGTSGAAPAAFIDKAKFFLKIARGFPSLMSIGFFVAVKGAIKFLDIFPEFQHWSIGDVASKEKVKTKNYGAGDGGPIANIGLPPLLARKVERVVVFINTPTRFKAKKVGNTFSDIKIDAQLAAYFGKNNKGEPLKDETTKYFDKSQFIDLISAFYDFKKPENPDAISEPIVVEKTYTVERNTHFGIEGGQEVKILWVYLDTSKLYESELADDTRVELIKDKAKVSDMETDDFEEITHSPEFSTGEWVKNLASFKHFPNYWTFFENLSTLRAIDLNNKQANLLSNYTTWIIKENDKSKRIFKSFFRD